MHRPYRTFYLSRLRGIAHQNWGSEHELKKILAELAERKFKDEVHALESEIALQVEHLQNQRMKQKQSQKELSKKLSKERGWFQWPSTEAPMGEGGMTAFWYEDGLFSYVGYHVGNTNGKPDDVRQELLDCIFHNDLPQVNSDEYMQEFNAPKTSKRLNKMADFLSAEARNFKRNPAGDYSKAIADYERDLDYLYREYYVGVFGFDWPTV